MSEYLIQGETLTGIADKIRPLLGLTGTMTPEQMQTNLTTEQANIAAALAALAEKGVEVPEGANSNALAGLIAAIESGGAKVASGTVTPANNNSITIEHGLGEKPNVFFWFGQDFVNHTKTEGSGGFYVTSRGSSDVVCGGYYNGCAFYVQTVGSLSTNFRYYVNPDNVDQYSRIVYTMTASTISSGSGVFAPKMEGETIFWVAAKI